MSECENLVARRFGRIENGERFIERVSGGCGDGAALRGFQLVAQTVEVLNTTCDHVDVQG
ncbi:hypothetical protein [Nonomuraea angiospora]|uniref:hypothetical protein n=1 Tax=Nonomuraea angiospora TaxID=46172 RepID=UPI003F54D118